MQAMSLVSRRAILMGLTGTVLAKGSLLAQTRRVSTPKPLAKDAVTHDWTSFLGPTHNAVSTETRLSRRRQPPLVWEFTKGTGYGSPAIAGERLVFLHRLRGEEIVECLHAETGAPNWQFRYPTDFEDRYGYNDGPRASPIIDGARTYTVGAQGQLHCLDLETGQSDLEARPRQGIPRPSGFFRESINTADRGSTPHRERRRPRRSVRRRLRQDHRTRSLAGRHRVGRKLRLADSGRRPRTSGASSCLPEASRIRRPAD